MNSGPCLNVAPTFNQTSNKQIAVFSKARQMALPTALAMALSAGAAAAAPLPSRPVLTLEGARTVVAAAEAKAKAVGAPCVISVVDADGLPIILERIDDAAVLAGVELAPGKARTAALFRRESAALDWSLLNVG
jgi:glc operon protein GlcG